MQTNSQPKLLPVPFADGGSKQTIPVASQIGITAGRASYTDGFPPLTRTPLAAGGVPPFGTDINGVLNDITAAIRWKQSGAGYTFDSNFSTAISGYPKGAKLTNSTFDGFWLNTVDGNTTAPEATDSSLTGWVPSESYGVSSITGLSGTSISLSSLQASKDRIILSGTLTANIIINLPAWIKKWTVLNNCSGSFSVTMKTVNGTGVAIPSGSSAVIQGDGSNIIPATSPGSLINIQMLTGSGTYNPSNGTNSVIIEAVGAGGGGGGANAGGRSGDNYIYSVAGGGGSGAYARFVLKSSFSNLAYSCGKGGLGGNKPGAANNQGSPGGQTTFGSILTLPGGYGGSAATTNNTFNWGSVAGGGFGADAPTLASSAKTILAMGGAVGASGQMNNANGGAAGGGANTSLGNGGSGATNGPGGEARGYGSGGGGALTIQSNTNSQAGGNGGDGFIIVWEYA
ncbi:hypothetical protein [Pantoea ananatis]|uniref:glycine-rich domain-containing protein n=1 Tax=Pantoea ananas TaxID=553 RepID=UPI001B30A1C5|nr:hypothetical protein [Pantoea ananatis]